MTAPPRLTGGLPWLGHAAAFGRDPVSFLREGQGRLGDVFSFRLLGQSVVYLGGPKAQEAFFRAGDEVLSAKEAYKFMAPVFGEGIAYDAEPEIMDEQIGLILPSLTARRLNAYAEAIADEATAYLGRWADQGEANLPAVMNELAVAIVSRCIFGAEFRSHLTAELASLYHDLESGIRLGGLVNAKLPLPAFRRRDRARERITAFIAAVMKERKATGAVDREDFLGTLMDARYADGSSLSDQTIAGLILTVIFASQSTSAVLGAWTGVLLLQHPERVKELRAEQQAVFRGDREMTTQRIHRLEKLHRCVKEAERLHPPLPVLMRVALKDFAVAGHEVPPGTLVMISPGVSHRSPAVFRDPEVYDPERFAPGREEDRRTPYALIGFGGGKHRCVGIAFAYQQVKVIWTILLRDFDLELMQQAIGPDYSTLVVGPKQPCRIRYQRRVGPE